MSGDEFAAALTETVWRPLGRRACVDPPEIVPNWCVMVHQRSDEQATDYVSSTVCRASLTNLRTACMSRRLFSE
jgi:hypothetical protein